MKEITNEMLKDLMNDEDFVAELRTAHTEDEILQVMSDNGIELTREQFEEGYEQVLNVMEGEGYFDEEGEMTEKGLELVSGGLRKGVANTGLLLGAGGLAAMMAGPITAGAVACWAAGCAIGTVGVLMPSKKSKKNKKNKRG